MCVREMRVRRVYLAGLRYVRIYACAALYRGIGMFSRNLAYNVLHVSVLVFGEITGFTGEFLFEVHGSIL